MTVWIGILFVAVVVWILIRRSQRVTPGEAQVAAAHDAQLRCPHCGVPGMVTSRTVWRKRGVSGGKATGALLTAGISMLATGLSRKQRVTERRCENCSSVWDVE